MDFSGADGSGRWSGCRAVFTAAGWIPAFFLLSEAFLTQEMGCLPAALQRFGGLLALSLAMGLRVRTVEQPSPPSARWRYGAEAAVIGLAALAVAAHLDGLVGVGLALWGLDRLERRYGRLTDRTLRVLLVTTVFYAIFLVWRRAVPAVWYALDTVSEGWSRGLGEALQHSLRLGPSVLGLPLLLLCLLYTMLYTGSLNRSPGPGHWWRLLATLGGVLSAPLVYCGLLRGVAGVRGEGSPEVASSWLFQGVQNGHLLLFGLAWLPVAGFLVPAPEGAVPTKGWRRSGLGFLGLTLSFLLLRWPSGQEEGGRGRMVLFDGRPSYLVNWAAPTAGIYGERSGGMYGMWPVYLERMGFTVRRTKPDEPLQRETLAEAAIFVTINPDRAFTPSERKALWEFVAAGGGLLVLGEHTGGGGNWRALNDLLQPFAIRLNFDTAWPTRTNWVDSLEVRPPAAAWTAGRERSTGLGVGASLTVRPPAWPLVVGRFGWADQGNWHNQDKAYLGDTRWTYDERLGDLVLAAAERYGRGKVVVLGDTSTFQNTMLQDTYLFAKGLFGWLCRPEVERRAAAVGGAGLLLVGTLFAFWPWHGSSGGWVLAVLLVGGMRTWELAGQRILPQPVGVRSTRPVAYVEADHLNRFSNVPDSKLATWGLTYNLIRAGYLPLRRPNGWEPRAPDDARLWVIIAPLRPYWAREIAEVCRFARRGGLVLMTVGYEEAEPAEGLLSAWGCRIGPTPLGSCEVPWDGDGPPVHFHKAWPVEARAPGAEVVLTHAGYPVVVFCPAGTGGLLMIGDSDFLLNRNLEGKGGYWLGNIRFLHRLLATYPAKGSSS